MDRYAGGVADALSVVRWFTEQRSMPEALAGIDSGTTLLRALARCLHREDLPALGLAPRRAASRPRWLTFRSRQE